MREWIVEFFRTYLPGWTGVIWGVVFSLVGTLLVLFIAGYVVVRLPHDYFHNPSARHLWMTSHPALRGLGIALKNLFGGILLLIGVIMVLPGVPGPGALIMLIAILFLDFPGKMRLERWLFGRALVLSQVNRLRARFGRPPMVVPQTARSSGE